MGFLGGGGGKQKSTSESGNKNLEYINSNFSPWVDRGGQGVNMMGDILMGGPQGEAALNDYWDSSGGKFLLDQGLEGLTNQYTKLGLSKSGPAMKGMETFRQGLASTKLDNYLGHLGQLGQLGLGAGGLITQAGQYSKSKSSGDSGGGGGLGSLIGSIIGAAATAGAFCDRRLKTNIVRTGKRHGVPEYDFTYRDGLGLPAGRFRGVMADEVARLRPEALGPLVHGYRTVSDPSLFPQRISA